MRKILLVALAAAAMVSCSENEEFENGSTANRIQFGTVVKTGTNLGYYYRCGLSEF